MIIKFYFSQLDTVREENEVSNKIKQRKSQPTRFDID